DFRKIFGLFLFSLSCVLYHGVARCLGLVVSFLFPAEVDDPLRCYKLFWDSFVFISNVLASPSGRRGLGKGPVDPLTCLRMQVLCEFFESDYDQHGDNRVNWSALFDNLHTGLHESRRCATPLSREMLHNA